MSPSYDNLVARLTEYARRHPRGYRVRVAALALLGYAYLFAIAALLAALVAGLLWLTLNSFGRVLAIKLAIPVVLLLGFIGKALWVKFTPPAGLELRPGDAPRLMAEIEAVRTAMRAPRVHRVLIDDKFNAGVSQYPRWGIFGGYRVYLVLGLPLLAALPTDEFRAVLAHEFGHVSRAHGRFGAWILRVQHTWSRLVGELDETNHPAQWLFTGFFGWYAPYFKAYTTVLSRANEFEADAMAARISPGAVGPSLCRIQVAARFLKHSFWPDVLAQARTSPEPPPGVHRRLMGAMREAGSHPLAAEWLAEGLRQPTRIDDSHPATAERLAAVGAEPAPAPAFQRSAAEDLLGDRAELLASVLNRLWANEVRPYWREQHRSAAGAAVTLEALQSRAEPLSPEEHGERVRMTAALHGDRAAVPMARALLDADQGDASVHLLLGRALAAESDLAALPHLDRAMELDDELTLPACAAATALLERLARDAEAAPYHRRMAIYQERMRQAKRERTFPMLTPNDRFIPHGLNAEQLASVRAAVGIAGIRRAYVVRKRVKHFPEQPLYVIGLLPTFGIKLPSTVERTAQAVLNGLTLPGTSLVLTVDGDQGKYRRAFRDVHAAEVYRAPSLLARALGRKAA